MLIFFLVFINHQYMYFNSWPIPTCHLTFSPSVFLLTHASIDNCISSIHGLFQHFNSVFIFVSSKAYGFLHLGKNRELKKMFIKTRQVLKSGDGPLTMPIEYYLKSLWFVGGFYLGV